MKKIIFIIFILLMVFSVNANANHHRAHARYFIRTSVAHLNIALSQLYHKFHAEEDGVFIDKDVLANYRSVLFYSNQALIKAGKMQDIVEISSLCVESEMSEVNDMLKGVRRDLTQPRHASIKPLNHSAVSRFNFAMIHLARFINLANKAGEPINTEVVSKFMERLAQAWRTTDLAIWHIGDAHLEEIDRREENGFGHDPLVDPAGFAQTLIFDPCS